MIFIEFKDDTKEVEKREKIAICHHFQIELIIILAN